MTKTLNQIFFSSTKIRIFFSTTLGIRIFFLEKKHNPPPPSWKFTENVESIPRILPQMETQVNIDRAKIMFFFLKEDCQHTFILSMGIRN
jgi:hypothetical protein